MVVPASLRSHNSELARVVGEGALHLADNGGMLREQTDGGEHVAARDKRGTESGAELCHHEW